MCAGLGGLNVQFFCKLCMIVYAAAGVLPSFSSSIQLPDDLLHALVSIYNVFSAPLEFLGDAMERMQQAIQRYGSNDELESGEA